MQRQARKGFHVRAEWALSNCGAKGRATCSGSAGRLVVQWRPPPRIGGRAGRQGHLGEVQLHYAILEALVLQRVGDVELPRNESFGNAERVFRDVRADTVGA